MAKLRQIAQLGNTALRQQATAVEFDSEKTHSIISDMLATLAESNGVGLAAPQIYEPYRIVVIASRPTPRYPNAPEMKPTVMLNPSFKNLSDHTQKDWEGCLSIPGIRGLVPRFSEIEVSYTDQNGQTIDLRLEDFIARVFQHEYDHLNGMVYLDRIESNRDLMTELEFNKQMVN